MTLGVLAILGVTRDLFGNLGMVLGSIAISLVAVGLVKSWVVANLWVVVGCIVIPRIVFRLVDIEIHRVVFAGLMRFRIMRIGHIINSKNPHWMYLKDRI